MDDGRTSPDTTAAGIGGIVPILSLDGASRAAAFYAGPSAREVFRHPTDDKGRTMHIHLYINGGSLMLADPYPEHGHPHRPAQGYTLHLKVDDVGRLVAARGRRRCRSRAAPAKDVLGRSLRPSA